MKTNIATNQDQAARLLRCGVSADTADMFHQTPITASQKETREDILLVRKADKTLFNTDIPAWSLSALLGLLPKEVFDKDSNGFYFSLAQEFPACDDYNAAYKPYWDDDDNLVGKFAPCPIEACVRLIEWLKGNGYKLNEQ